MKLAIHNSQVGFHPRWVEYCKKKTVDYKVVNCYANDIIAQLQGCNALMWHFSQSNSKDIIIAKQIMFALEHVDFKVFPDFKTAWHFDDKVAQKYLFEAINAPMVPSYAFYDKSQAIDWVSKTNYPKVFKLRGGAGSANVKLARNKQQALKLINIAFGKGFSQYEGWTNLKERLRKYRQGKTTLKDVGKGIVRLGYQPYYSKIIGRERGYVYFQEFMPNNNSDTRIILIDNKAFALKRMVRKGDFRASGSGEFHYSKEVFDERCVRIAFETNKKINSQCIAYDFVFDLNNNPLIVEISYGFAPSGYRDCPGYWDEQLNWNREKFRPEDWMVESVLKQIKASV
jgi:glutathione synthase/RimK-type ligase-like ATP-grasp enzyme